MENVTVGIDIGGTSTKYGLVTKEGEIIYQSKIPTTKYPDFDDYLIGIKKAIDDAIAHSGNNTKVTGVGVGAPNANSNKGTIEMAPNLPWKGVVPFVEKLSETIGVPVVITNDANAAAVGEMVFGNAKGMTDFIVITLGTGLGSGIVANGKVINGHHGFGGELGHTMVKPDGRHCSCGKRGCLETYVSATGIKRTIYKLLADSLEDSELRGVSFNNLNTKMITEAAQRNDRIALEAFEYTGKILGTKLSDTVVHTDPEAIFLFGGLSLAGEFIFEPTKRYMEEHLMSIFKDKVEIIPSGLQNQSAPILGASSLVRDIIN